MVDALAAFHGAYRRISGLSRPSRRAHSPTPDFSTGENPSSRPIARRAAGYPQIAAAKREAQGARNHAQ